MKFQSCGRGARIPMTCGSYALGDPRIGQRNTENNQPNQKQEVAGHATATVIGTLLGLGLIVKGGKLEKALAGAIISFVVHAVLDQPISHYIAGHPQEFPRFLAQ